MLNNVTTIAKDYRFFWIVVVVIGIFIWYFVNSLLANIFLILIIIGRMVYFEYTDE